MTSTLTADTIKLSDIAQVYSGKRGCCMCGCSGTYLEPDLADESNPDNAKVLRTAKKVLRGEWTQSRPDALVLTAETRIYAIILHTAHAAQ